jgi:hypothetical protein
MDSSMDKIHHHSRAPGPRFRPLPGALSMPIAERWCGGVGFELAHGSGPRDRGLGEVRGRPA